MNKAELQRIASGILGSHRPGDILSGNDSETIRGLLESHPNYGDKIGCGVEHIFIGVDAYKHPCFWIKRIDGSKTDFSYLKCIKGDDGQYAKFCKACREAVSDQVAQVSGGAGTHTHHDEIQFAQIVNDFIKAYSINIDGVKYARGDGLTTTKFSDDGLGVTFALYHKRRAKLVSIPIEQHKNIPVARYK